MNLPTNLILSLFEKDILRWPDVDDDVLALNIHFTSKIENFTKINVEQIFKPYADEFNNDSCKAYIKTNEKSYKYALCNLPKQKIAAKYDLARALRSLKQSGCLVASAPNDAGGKRLEKWFKELNLTPQSLSKSKCRVVWAKKENCPSEKIEAFFSAGAEQSIVLDGVNYITKPGIYGWNKIDKGSKGLLKTTPNLSGVGADYGCGYGFLSKSILSNNNVKKLYVLDADYNALECCKKNLNEFSKKIVFDWVDLTKKQKIESLDWIIMNPPFHEGKETDINIGHRFIESAHAALKKTGTLYMVANSHLPYEKILNNLFSSVSKIKEDSGFKIFHAQK